MQTVPGFPHFLSSGDGGVLSNLKAIVPCEKINSRRQLLLPAAF